jgi:hypothetical protein
MSATQIIHNIEEKQTVVFTRCDEMRTNVLTEGSVCPLGALTLRPRTIRPPVQFIFSLGGPIDPQRAV